MITRAVTATFLITAAMAGALYGAYAVALPLYASSIGQAASVTGALLAVGTITVALGSIAAGVAARSINARTLAPLGIGVAALGDVILIQGSFAALALGSVLVGSGLGLYWAGIQAMLSAQSGQPNSERAFINQYVVYSLGTVSASVLSGGISSLAHLGGVPLSAATRAGFVVGLACAAIALLINRSQSRSAAARAGRVAMITGGAGRDAFLQLSDLCLVAGLAFILALAPVILSDHLRFNSLQVGASYGAVTLGKMGGSFLAGRVVRRRGYRRGILLTLLAGTLLSLLLAFVRQPIVFVVVLVFAGMVAGGVWPVVVDATLASARPERRAAMALTWSAREYPVIALATILGGWMLGQFHSTTVLYLVTAGLLMSAALASRLLRGPLVLDA